MTITNKENIMKKVIAVMVLVALMVGSFMIGTAFDVHTKTETRVITQVEKAPVPQTPFWVSTPCDPNGVEDQINCFWDAGIAGNGKGHSWVARMVPGSKGMICVFYLEKAYAAENDYCS